MFASVEQIKPSLSHLSPMAQNAICSKATNDEVGPGLAMFAWLSDLLALVKPIDTEKRIALLTFFEDDIIKIGEKIWDYVSSKKKVLPVCWLMLSDRRYACVSGQKNILDIETGKTLMSIDEAITEQLCFNLTTVFTKNELVLRLANREATNADNITRV